MSEEDTDPPGLRGLRIALVGAPAFMQQFPERSLVWANGKSRKVTFDKVWNGVLSIHIAGDVVVSM
ncbi:hypothetical protein W97_01316 [Coniosporium apollinis CBS 100218]|uniref:Uncharacterized protein n=1 Tax=Coniosporium apollinis (strain CBS 100218) TaxID=1168221 RepID=R7YJL8_CONA1|nr:uncharacterized protein W97_01316 [Coniosporium apollinis CBS 100218]EON62097.1 hypothetical protein W97_01316 [Coniosporium apollinis CBS 100218]